MKLEFSRQILDKYPKFMKSVRWEPSFLCAQTDVMKVTVVFLNYAIAPKNT